jgi:hypothetical protein
MDVRQKEGEPQWRSVKAKRVGSNVLSNPFTGSGTSEMELGITMSIMSLCFGMLGFVILGLTIIEHL